MLRRPTKIRDASTPCEHTRLPSGRLFSVQVENTSRLEGKLLGGVTQFRIRAEDQMNRCHLHIFFRCEASRPLELSRGVQSRRRPSRFVGRMGQLAPS